MKPYLSSPRSRHRGFSLIELMIGLVIGLVVIGAVLYTFLGSRLTYKFNDNMGRLQESGRIAIELIAEDLRMTGFIGCRRMQSYLPSGAIYFSTDFIDDIAQRVGIASASELDFNNTHGAVFDTAPSIDQWPQTDSITVLVGAGEIPLETEMSNPGSDLDTGSRIVPAGPAIIADCLYDSGLSLSDSSPTGVPAPAEGFIVENEGSSIAHSGFERVYGADAAITPLSAVSYSIRDTGRTDLRSAAIPALYRGDEELIEGARGLCVRYGLADSSSNSAISSTGFVEAAAVTDWRQVIAVRVDLLLASVEDRLLDSPQTGIEFCSDDPINATDHRLYKVFSTTVGLRNQLMAN